jgi:hypothetical protein
MFFNRQERDILWHSELDGLAAKDERCVVILRLAALDVSKTDPL